jgi:integrase
LATYRKRGSTWRAEIWRDGKRESSTHRTKAEAVAWATQREQEIVAGEPAIIARKTLRDALERYAEEESPKHEGERWDRIRLKKIARDMGDEVVDRPLREITSDAIARWRNKRLREVAPGSVAREMGLLRAVLNTAVQEWRWIAQSPAKGVKRPPKTPPRTRRVSDAEALKITAALGFIDDKTPETVSQRIAIAFLFAIETAMRLGEICALTRGNLHKRHVHLPKTKNSDARDVPLSKRARELLALLPEDGDSVFNLRERSVDALFRRARDKTGITNLTLHDSRHEAITRLAKKVDVLTLARIVGHRDPRSLMVYFNPTIDEVADLLG